ncbi:MAG: recombinase family protein [Oscillatoriales cyanobacterium RU_3_3]|nr:recombinase family protein [Oscillatoriales cyanobacterium RU_3_3]
MVSDSIWIAGSARSGKTTRLIEQFCKWSPNVKSKPVKLSSSERTGLRAIGQTAGSILVLAANGENRLELADRITVATGAKSAFHSTTPFGFFEQEVMLFWPLLIQLLELKTQFPLRLQPETELELAARLWQPELEEGILRQPGVSPNRMVRRTLDIFQLAAVSGTSAEEIPAILEQGFAGENGSSSLFASMGELLLRWREWCLARGFLTYGIISELYWRYLLKDSTYQQRLLDRYHAIIADDADDYPAICRDLFELMLDRDCAGAFSYNPDGGARSGLGADPEYIAGLAARCKRVERLEGQTGLAEEVGELAINLAVNSYIFYPLNLSMPESVRSVSTTSRAQLLRETAEIIAEAVKSKTVQPQEIAVIAPGMDAIARYSLTEILARDGIAAEPLNDQRPLSSSPTIRSLLTLLALVYPGLGRLADRDAVAEMLVVLGSQKYQELEDSEDIESPFNRQSSTDNPQPTILNRQSKIQNPINLKSKIQNLKSIDPVRAGLIADCCFCPDVEKPQLLPITAFPRWDRVGHRAAAAYEQIVAWIEDQRSQQQQRLLPSPLSLLDRAIQKFLISDRYLPYDQLAALRELMETATHYWQIDARMQRLEPNTGGDSEAIARFIQLLRRGTVTANPFPVRPDGSASKAVTLANIFQYRSSRRAHKWHFWLDAGSPLWLSGGAATLFGAPLFLQSQLGRPWQTEDETAAGEERLRRILLDLLSRCEALYLCHSELATNGQEQTGPLLPLIHSSKLLRI